MVSIKSFIATSAAILATFVTVEAAVAPTYPSPGTIQTQGQSYDITWTFDGNGTSATYQIDFMTGSNDNQTVLANVAKGVKGSELKYPFVAPAVTPNSAIYFFMFTGSDGQAYWTTRFGIITPGGTLTAESEKKQPNGDAIPWGVGQLLTSTTNTTVVTTAAVTTAANTSAVVTNAPATIAAAAAASSAVVSSGIAAASNPPAITSAAQVVAKTNAGHLLQPALGFISAVAATAYFVL